MGIIAYNHFSESETGLVYKEEREPLISAGIAFFGLMAVGVGLVFLTEIIAWPLNSGKIAGFFTVAVFLVMGSSACLLAFGGLRPQVLSFDKTTKRLSGKLRTKLWLLQDIDVAFHDLKKPCLKAIEREGDTDLFEVRMETHTQKVISLGAYEEPADASYWLRRIESMIQI